MPVSAHTQSYYAASAGEIPTHAPLQGTVSADVCVVGGGFTGITTALELAKKGYAVRLLEANKIGWGASGRNGGQVGTGQRKDSWGTDAFAGKEHSNRLWDLACEAKALILDRIETYGIDCDLGKGNLAAAWKKSDLEWMERYPEDMAERHGYGHCRFIPGNEIRDWVDSPAYFGGVIDQGTYHLHPLKYALGLARGAVQEWAVLHEDSAVTAIVKSAKGHRVETAEGSVEADHVVLACNGYLDERIPGIPKTTAAMIMPINNFIAATRPLSDTEWRALLPHDCCVHDTKFVVDYYKLSKDRRLLFGGGETYSSTLPDDIEGLVRKPLSRAFPQLKDIEIDYAWGGTLGITMRRLPSVGRSADGIYYGQGFSGSGVAMTGIVGKAMAEAIAGTAERFDVFASIPQPPFPGGTLLRFPGLVAGMLWYSLKDKLGRS